MGYFSELDIERRENGDYYPDDWFPPDFLDDVPDEDEPPTELIE
jgi:hypothetical protein